MDRISKRQRSEVMRRITKVNTGPERVVRSLVRNLGYRYRTYGSGIPGNPDIVFRSLRKVIFVHGCFWHQHPGCALARQPKSNLKYWLPKLEGNVQRDKRVRRRLGKAQWSYLTIWECQTRMPTVVLKRLERYLANASRRQRR
jgi:DNA mismatch endonuclease, patch repair protein